MSSGVTVDTPTVMAIRARQESRRLYVFRLDEAQVTTARGQRLPDSALMALAAISGAAYGARQGDWVTVPPRTMDCYGRSYRWWLRATTALQCAGLIEVRRHPGRQPRYRLKVASTEEGRTMG